MSQNRPAVFRGRHFEDLIIILCVRWYLRYSLSYRDLEERMAERGLSVDHVTIWRWVPRPSYSLVWHCREAAECGRGWSMWNGHPAYARAIVNEPVVLRLPASGDILTEI